MSDQELRYGKKLMLHCQARGLPTPSIEWIAPNNLSRKGILFYVCPLSNCRTVNSRSVELKIFIILLHDKT